MLAIKLQRIGRKHQPSYRVVVAERRSKLISPPVEDLGAYNTFSKTNTVKKERVEYWLKMGAQPTATVHNLLIKSGIISGSKIKIPIRKSKREAPPPEVSTPAVAPVATPDAESTTQS